VAVNRFMDHGLAGLSSTTATTVRFTAGKWGLEGNSQPQRIPNPYPKPMRDVALTTRRRCVCVEPTAQAAGVSSRDGSGRGASTSGRGSSSGGGGGGGAKRAPPSTPGSASKGKRAKQKGADNAAPAANQRTIQSFFAKPSAAVDAKGKGKAVEGTGGGSSVQPASSIARSSGRSSAGEASGSGGGGGGGAAAAGAYDVELNSSVEFQTACENTGEDHGED